MNTVVTGMAWLDNELPGWEAHIDVERLEMDSYHDCILGQLAEFLLADKEVMFSAGSDSDTLDYIDVIRVYSKDRWWSIDHGFHPQAEAMTHQAIQMLNLEWSGAITSRLAGQLIGDPA